MCSFIHEWETTMGLPLLTKQLENRKNSWKTYFQKLFNRNHRTRIPNRREAYKMKSIVALSFLPRRISRLQGREEKYKQSPMVLMGWKKPRPEIKKLRWLEFAGKISREEVAMTKSAPEIYIRSLSLWLNTNL